MRYLFLLLLLEVGSFASTQTSEKYTLADSRKAQKELNEEFTNPKTSILPPEVFKNFDGLQFYYLNTQYIVKAKFVRTEESSPFRMQTTTARKPEFVQYGVVYFTLKGKKLHLAVYRGTHDADNPDLKDYLFLPFTDLTNGEGSYAGGRYLDLHLPIGDHVILDFNTAYNPYCAYNPHYSCPIPPKENDLPIRIEAGVKAFKKESTR